MVFGKILEDMKILYGLNDKISNCLHFCVYSITIEKRRWRFGVIHFGLPSSNFIDISLRFASLALGQSSNFLMPMKQSSWWRHQMETFSALLAICAGNSPVPGELPAPVPGEFRAQRPMTWSFDVFFDVRLNKRLSKQSWGWWFETPLRPLWRQRNAWRIHLWIREFNRYAMSCYSTTTKQRITKPRAYINYTLWHTAYFTLKILPLLTPFEQHFI